MARLEDRLYLRVAVALDLLPEDVARAFRPGEDDTPDAASLEETLVAAGRLSRDDAARVRRETERRLAAHGGDPERALATLDDGEPGSAMQSHQMPTLPGAPVAGAELAGRLSGETTEADNRYTGASEYDRGGMGRILLAHDTVLRRDIALKELLPRVSASDATGAGASPGSTYDVARFLREARITGNLEHPSIIPVYDLGRRADGTHYYTMKLVRGKTLHRAIADARGLEGRMKLLPHVIDLCHAIAYAHGKGVIHRDIKPANVMVGSYGETVVLDWGLARAVDGEDPYAPDLAAGDTTPETGGDAGGTMAGIPLGTPHYMSPEQAEGRLAEVGPRSDVYALGVVLYELLTGATPFTGARNRDVLRQVREARPRPVTAREPGVPPALAAICAKAMARRPADRYASAAQLAEELNRFTAGALVRGYSYNFWELARHYYRRHRALCNTILVAVAVVFAVAATSYAYILDANYRERIQRQRAEAEAYRANIQLAASDIASGGFHSARERLRAQPAHLRGWEWGLLFAQCHEDLATAAAHRSPVHRLLPGPHGDHLVSIGQEGEVFVWAAPDLDLLHQFDLPALPNTGVTLSPDGDRLIISRMDGAVDLFDFRDYSRLQSVETGGRAFNQFIFSGDGTRFAAGAADGAIAIWNRSSATPRHQFQGHADTCYVQGMNHDGSVLVSSDRAGRTMIWDAARGTPMQEITGTVVATSRYGARFAVRDGSRVAVYDLETAGPVFEAETGYRGQGQALLDPEGHYFAARSDADSVRVWDLSTGETVQTLRNESAGALLAFCDDGHCIAMAEAAHSVKIHRVADGALIRTLRGHSSRVRSGAFGAGGDVFFTCAGDTEIKAWRISDPPPAPPVTGDRITGLDWSGTLGLAAAATMDGAVHFLDAGLTPVRTVASFEPAAYARAAFHPDGDRAALLLSSNTVFEVTVPEGEVLRQRAGHTGRVSALAYSPAGEVLATAASDRTIRLWPGDSGMDPRVFQAHPAEILSLAFVPGTRRILSGDRQGNLLEWNWQTLATTRRETFGNAGINAIAATPTGDRAACALADHTIQLLDLHAESPAVGLLGHDSPVKALAFSARGSRLISLSDRGEVKVWDVASGRELLALVNPAVLSDSLALADSRILVGGRNGLNAVFPAFPPALYGDGEITPETVARYKRERPGAGANRPVRPENAIGLVPAPTFSRAARKLRAAAAESTGESDAAYREPASNPLAPVGLRPGDTVRTVNGEPCTTVAQFRDRLGSALDDGAYARHGLTLEIQRDGHAFAVYYADWPVETAHHDFTISRDRALEILAGLRRQLRDFEAFVLDYNQRRAQRNGAGLTGRTALDGLWIPPPARQEDRETLAAFGLARGDRITAINGRPVTGYQAIQDAVDTAIRTLQSGGSGVAELAVQRDRFQQLRVQLRVE